MRFAHKDLLDRLDAGATVLTPTPLLAAVIESQHTRRQLQNGLRTWPIAQRCWRHRRGAVSSGGRRDTLLTRKWAPYCLPRRRLCSGRSASKVPACSCSIPTRRRLPLVTLRRKWPHRGRRSRIPPGPKRKMRKFSSIGMKAFGDDAVSKDGWRPTSCGSRHSIGSHLCRYPEISCSPGLLNALRR